MWSGDISAREGIETNLCSTLSQPNNFSLYTVFVFWMWSFKENKAATYFAGRVCFVVYVCHNYVLYKYNEMRLFGLFYCQNFTVLA